MPLINQVGAELPDRWVYPEAGEPGSFRPYHVGVFELLEALGALPVDAAPTGVLVNPETAPELLAAYLHQLHLVVIPFPKFRDGRGFSMARSLRKRHGFMHDLRAIGHLLPDQLPLLAQCGFTSIVPSAEHPPLQWQQQRSTNGEGTARPQPLLQRLVKRGS